MFGSCGFNTLIQKYLSENENKFIKLVLKNKTTEGNSDTMYFP